LYKSFQKETRLKIFRYYR